MAQMMQMMRAMGQEMPASAPILEINPDHEIVKKKKVKWLCRWFYNRRCILDFIRSSKIIWGMDITDTIAFAQRLSRITAKAL